MKHLRKFNESVEQDLKDIGLELQDIGMYMYIEKNRNVFYNPAIKFKNWNAESIYWKDVKDTIFRIKDYLGDRLVSFCCNHYVDLDMEHSGITAMEFIKLDESYDKIPAHYKIYAMWIEFEE